MRPFFRYDHPTLEDELVMGQLGITLNPAEMEPGRGGFDPIPSGWYAMQIVETDVVATKSGNGQILKLTWEVMEGPHEKAKVFDNINYVNDSEAAERIARGHLKNILDAVGYTEHYGDDTDVIRFIQVWAKVGGQPARNGYEASNKISDVKPYDPAGAPSQTKPAPVADKPTAVNSAPKAAPANRPAAPRTAAAGPATGSRPWARPTA